VSKQEDLWDLIEKYGKLESYKAGDVFHAQDFPQKLFMIKSGYVKRYQVNKSADKVLELIYGPRHIVSLSQLYKQLFILDQNQAGLVYVYQAMTDVKMQTVSTEKIIAELENEPRIYKDFFFESGLRLRSNIFRLASNALKDDYKKVAHQYWCLATEFGKEVESTSKLAVKILVPLKPIDMAEQLNISVPVADAVINSLIKSNLLSIEDDMVTVLDMDLLEAAYL
jgi:CRP-like cAMP-binding protein